MVVAAAAGEEAAAEEQRRKRAEFDNDVAGGVVVGEVVARRHKMVAEGSQMGEEGIVGEVVAGEHTRMRQLVAVAVLGHTDRDYIASPPERHPPPSLEVVGKEHTAGEEEAAEEVGGEDVDVGVADSSRREEVVGELERELE